MILVVTGFRGDRPRWQLPGGRTTVAADGDAARRALADPDRGLLVIGPELGSEAAKSLLADLPHVEALAVGWADELAAFGDELIAGRLFYLAAGVPGDAEMASLLRAMSRKVRGVEPAGPAQNPAEPAQATDLVQGVLDVAERAAMQKNSTACLELLGVELPVLLRADRGQALLFDAAAGTLWSGTERRGADRVESASVGLVSFVVRTGESLRLPSIRDDSRFDGEADDPEGDGAGPFVAAPVLGAGGRSLAVLSATRSAGAPPFDDADLERLERLASLVGGVLERFQADAEVAQTALAENSSPLFRREAAALRAGSQDLAPEPLQLSTGWTRLGFALLLVAMATAAAAGLLVPIPQTVGGEARVFTGPDGAVEVAAAFPPEAARLLAVGQELRLEGPGGARDFRIRELEPGPRRLSEIGRGLGGELLPGAGPSVWVIAAAPDAGSGVNPETPTLPPGPCAAKVVLGESSLLGAWSPWTSSDGGEAGR
ncbi:MAG: GAF domain-containing protein [Acidobacteriota bacterium]